MGQTDVQKLLLLFNKYSVEKVLLRENALVRLGPGHSSPTSRFHPLRNLWLTFHPCQCPWGGL